MATAAYEKPLFDLTLPAAADLSAKQYYAVAQNSSGQAALASAQGQRCIGILQDDPTAANQASLVRTHGVSKAVLGGTVAYDDLLTADANGKLIKATSNGEHVLGRALSSGAANEIIPMLMSAAPASAGATGYVLPFYVNLASITGAGDVVTAFTPGHAGKITKVDFVTSVAVTTAAKAASLNVEIGTTNLTGGVVALTSANCTPMGAVVAGSAVTAANTFSATDTISIEASSVTAFSEGSGMLLLTIQ